MVKSYIPVLTIAGSDSSGGAGIQADLKTFSSFGCYGMSVITATTAQNTRGVKSVHAIPVQHIREQLETVLEDIVPKSIKIGMVNRPEVARTLADILKHLPDIPIVFDPVMVATSGDRLIEFDTIQILKDTLFPLCSLLTPNLDESSILSGMDINNEVSMEMAGRKIIEMGCKAVLVKGGHLKAETVKDLLIQKDEKIISFESEYIATKNLHGTGCTMSSAIAAELAKGQSLENSVKNAKVYISGAIAAGKDVVTGTGHGPLNHFYEPQKQIINEVE
ncbi:MAG: bifunctional hydroxymethylpyrimidine kinase/phosphomethylpyrimidine kinase [Mongoliibacter sp.]|uniref:bifunctional hydroxymethylpyrimidine kinase/phosphomethylpyrimidine kinase n=1 Tax=Mongoliibacter sp. TaxID=2022438 RepID=UPI0012EF06DC|nr:bifunctional hydroxymethylpyrimidine kinase/phosphomethylpyrimidine kinase [Mongoliibacter sp.]TVP51762.1 MAG: bifunctional hydroxymethylpyrimidine kinase/phosphomethylpyrimidine kinase [Mongoliibacter sp.]